MPVDMTTQIPQQLAHRVDVGKPRHPSQRRLPLRHQARGHDRQRAVFAPADLDFALETLPTIENKTIHLALPWPQGPKWSARANIARAFFGLSASPLADDQSIFLIY